MKKYFSLILSVLILLAVVLGSGCSTDSGFNFHTELQEKYLNSSNYFDISPYACGMEELSKPKPYKISLKDGGEGPYVVEISLNSDLSNAETYEANGTSFDYYNLLSDQTYYYRVTGTKISKIKSFKTAVCLPRNIAVDGVTNFRDLGGYKTDEGRTVKQGLLYRSAQLNLAYLKEVSPSITESGIDVMKNQLKIKTEIDLRAVTGNEVGGLKEGNGTGVLGEGVYYYQCPMGAFDSDESKASVKRVMEILSDEDNYPVVFHCAIGTDRTGYIAYLVSELLQISDKNKTINYMFSNFGTLGSNRLWENVKCTYPDGIINCVGRTRDLRIKNYITYNSGFPFSVTEERTEFVSKLDKIKNILLV